MSNPYSKFEEVVLLMKKDFDKFYDEDINAAGARVRKHLQTLATLCKEGRKEVTEVKAARAAAK